MGVQASQEKLHQQQRAEDFHGLAKKDEDISQHQPDPLGKSFERFIFDFRVKGFHVEHSHAFFYCQQAQLLAERVFVK